MPGNVFPISVSPWLTFAKRTLVFFMNESSKSISKLIFQRRIGDNTGQIKLTSDMLKVLAVLDGRKNIEQVSKTLGMPLIEMRKILGELYRLRLVALKAVPYLPQSFFQFMEAQVAEVMGPIAGMLIDDTLKQMGEIREKFPVNRAIELVEKVAGKFIVDEKKPSFINVMRGHLKSLQSS